MHLKHANYVRMILRHNFIHDCCYWLFFKLILSVQKCRFGEFGIWGLRFGPKWFEIWGWDSIWYLGWGLKSICIQELEFDIGDLIWDLPITGYRHPQRSRRRRWHSGGRSRWHGIADGASPGLRLLIAGNFGRARVWVCPGVTPVKGRSTRAVPSRPHGCMIDPVR